MYIVTSNPNLISVYVGLVHIIFSIKIVLLVVCCNSQGLSVGDTASKA